MAALRCSTDRILMFYKIFLFKYTTSFNVGCCSSVQYYFSTAEEFIVFWAWQMTQRKLKTVGFVCGCLCFGEICVQTNRRKEKI